MVLTLRASEGAGMAVLVAARFQGVTVAVEARDDIKDSHGNASVELETQQGVLRSEATCLRYVSNLYTSAGFGGVTPFEKAKVDQWIDFAFNEMLPRRLSAAIHAKRAMLQTLVNMGVRGSPIQRSLRARCKNIIADLTRLNNVLFTRSFLVGNAITAADVAVAAALDVMVAFLISPTEREALPNVMRWFTTVRSQPQFESVVGTLDICGVREGGQIDRRPDPKVVAALADASVALNVGFKKQQSQRDKEKAKKNAGGAGAGAGAGATAEPAAAAPAAPTVAATATQPESNLTDRNLTVDEKIAKTEAKLTELNLDFKTMEELQASIPDSVDAVLCKNLLTKAKKKKDEDDTMLWLIVAAGDTATPLKKIQRALGYGNITLRFASEKYLEPNLGVIKGSVTPFATMNDTAQQVNVVLDQNLVGKPALGFHPLTNEATTIVSWDALTTFLKAVGHNFIVMDFSAE